MKAAYSGVGDHRHSPGTEPVCAVEQSTHALYVLWSEDSRVCINGGGVSAAAAAEYRA